MKIELNKYVPAPVPLVRVFLRQLKQNHLVRRVVRELSRAVGACVLVTTISTSIVHAQEANPDASPSQPSVAQNTSPQSSMKSHDDTQPRPATTSDWLLQLSRVVKTHNFQVAFVQSRVGRETVPFLWRHAIMEDGTTMEQLNLQNGPGRELIRVNDIVSVFEPDVPPYSLRSEFINGPIPSELLYHPERLKSGYEFVSVGRARVAGRPAQQIRIVSRDNSRFSYQLWLDENTGMLLKLNMLDLQGGVLEQIQVTSLVITDEPDEYFTRINQASLPKPMVITQKQSRPHSWQVGYLPNGMHEVRRDTRRLALTGQVVEYKMFSDGLVDVSVYVQPVADAIGDDLVLRHDLSTFLTLTVGKAQVTVVGEIPLQTANAIATSLSAKVE